MPDRGEAQVAMLQNRQGTAAQGSGGQGAVTWAPSPGLGPAVNRCGVRRVDMAWGSEPRPRVPLPALQLA